MVGNKILKEKMFPINVPEKILIGDIISVNNNEEFVCEDNIKNKSWIGRCICFEKEKKSEYIDGEFNIYSEISSCYGIEMFLAENLSVLRLCKKMIKSNKEVIENMPRKRIYSEKGDIVFKLNETPLFLQTEGDSKIGEMLKFYRNNELECIFINLIFEKDESLFNDYDEFLNTFKNYLKEI